MIRCSWKMTAVAVTVVAMIFSSQASSAATSQEQSVNGVQPNACTAIATAKLDLTSVRASLEHFDQRAGSKFGAGRIDGRRGILFGVAFSLTMDAVNPLG